MCAAFEDMVKNEKILLLSKRRKPDSEFIYRLETVTQGNRSLPKCSV